MLLIYNHSINTKNRWPSSPRVSNNNANKGFPFMPKVISVTAMSFLDLNSADLSILKLSNARHSFARTYASEALSVGSGIKCSFEPLCVVRMCSSAAGSLNETCNDRILVELQVEELVTWRGWEIDIETFQCARLFGDELRWIATKRVVLRKALSSRIPRLTY